MNLRNGFNRSDNRASLRGMKNKDYISRNREGAPSQISLTCLIFIYLLEL